MKLRNPKNEPVIDEVYVKDGYECQECGFEIDPEADPRAHERKMYSVYVGGEAGDRDNIEDWETRCERCFTPTPRIDTVESGLARIADGIDLILLIAVIAGVGGGTFLLTITAPTVLASASIGVVGLIVTYITLRLTAWDDPTGRLQAVEQRISDLWRDRL